MMLRRVNGAWECPKKTEALAAARLNPMQYYIDKHQAMIAQTIKARHILEEYRGAEQRKGTKSCCWWQGQVLDYTGDEKKDASEGLDIITPETILQAPLSPPVHPNQHPGQGAARHPCVETMDGVGDRELGRLMTVT